MKTKMIKATNQVINGLMDNVPCLIAMLGTKPVEPTVTFRKSGRGINKKQQMIISRVNTKCVGVLDEFITQRMYPQLSFDVHDIDCACGMSSVIFTLEDTI